MIAKKAYDCKTVESLKRMPHMGRKNLDFRANSGEALSRVDGHTGPKSLFCEEVARLQSRCVPLKCTPVWAREFGRSCRLVRSRVAGGLPHRTNGSALSRESASVPAIAVALAKQCFCARIWMVVPTREDPFSGWVAKQENWLSVSTGWAVHPGSCASS